MSSTSSDFVMLPPATGADSSGHRGACQKSTARGDGGGRARLASDASHRYGGASMPKPNPDDDESAKEPDSTAELPGVKRAPAKPGREGSDRSRQVTGRMDRASMEERSKTPARSADGQRVRPFRGSNVVPPRIPSA